MCVWHVCKRNNTSDSTPPPLRLLGFLTTCGRRTRTEDEDRGEEEVKKKKKSKQNKTNLVKPTARPSLGL